MTSALSTIVSLLLKLGVGLLVLNEVRGFVLAAPVLYAMYEAGGTIMALWIGFCSLAGIAISVLLPVIAARQIQRRFDRWQARLAIT
jgi:hypothetical protein